MSAKWGGSSPLFLPVNYATDLPYRCTCICVLPIPWQQLPPGVRALVCTAGCQEIASSELACDGAGCQRLLKGQFQIT